MEPSDFPQANLTLTAPERAGGDVDPKIVPLRVWTDNAQTISCWKLTWRERLSALVFGTAWLSVRFGRTAPPVWLTVERSPFIKPANPKA